MTTTAGNIAGPCEEPSRASQPLARAQNASLLALLPIVLLIYSALLPPEVRITIAGQNLYAPRIVGFGLLPFLLFQMARGSVPLRPIDGLMFLGAFWMVFSFGLYYGPGEGVIRGSALAFDIIIPYLLTRQCIRSLIDLRRLLVMISPGIMLVGFTMMFETIGSRLIIRPLAASIFGPLPSYVEGDPSGAAVAIGDSRFGLVRAYGPFSHPILGGIFMASMLPLYWSSGLRGWPFLFGAIASSFALFTFSSGAYLFIVLAVGLLAYEFLQARIAQLNWPLALVGLFAILFTLHVISQNGIFSVLARYTLTPHTAQFRLLIWEYGVMSVMNHPWIGIGFSSYERLPWMGDSVDAHWLLLAIRHGVIVPASFLAVVIISIAQLGSAGAGMKAVDRLLIHGLCICLGLLCILGFTVAYFGSSLTWFFIVLGIVASLGARHDSICLARNQSILR